MKYFFVLMSLFFTLQVTAQNPYDNIGREHNEGLRYVLQNLQKIPAKNEVKSTVVSILKERYTEEGQQIGFELAFDQPTLENYLSFVQQRVDKEFFAEVRGVIDVLATGISLPDFIKYIENAELNVNKKFTGKNLDNFYIFLSVIKHSAMFWYPTEQGGENGAKYLAGKNIGGSGRQSYQNFDDLKILAVNWWKVVGCDAVGAIGGGILGGGGGALVGGCVASACSAINQW